LDGHGETASKSESTSESEVRAKLRQRPMTRWSSEGRAGSRGQAAADDVGEKEGERATTSMLVRLDLYVLRAEFEQRLHKIVV
jgi:hypothetical protein